MLRFHMFPFSVINLIQSIWGLAPIKPWYLAGILGRVLILANWLCLSKHPWWLEKEKEKQPGEKMETRRWQPPFTRYFIPLALWDDRKMFRIQLTSMLYQRRCQKIASVLLWGRAFKVFRRGILSIMQTSLFILSALTAYHTYLWQ